MRILITGGAGYIGSVITNLALQNNYRIRSVDSLWFQEKVPLIHFNNPNYEFVKADLRDDELLNGVLQDVDFVVHAAAVVGDPASKKFPALTREINFRASMQLIKKVRNFKIKGFIFLSTCSNYGVSESLVNEDSPLKPLSLYAETKVNIERYLMDKVRDLDWVICRLSTAYGSSPRMRFDLTVNDFTLNAYMKRYLDVFLPYSQRPYTHVFDIANIIIQLIKNFKITKNNVFNIGFNAENYQKIQIAEIVNKFVPGTKIEIIKSGMDLRDYQVDFSKLKKYLNIKNFYTVKDGVKEIIGLLRLNIINDPRDKKYYNIYPNFKNKCVI